jgi:CNT family concentrative nucleoside transporter
LKFLIGFANFGSMGVALATLGVFAPTRKRALIKIAPRALIGGNMVSLMTASIAGIDIKKKMFSLVSDLYFRSPL